MPTHSPDFLPTSGPSKENSKHLSVKEIRSSNWKSNLCQTAEGQKITPLV